MKFVNIQWNLVRFLPQLKCSHNREHIDHFDRHPFKQDQFTFKYWQSLHSTQQVLTLKLPWENVAHDDDLLLPQTW